MSMDARMMTIDERWQVHNRLRTEDIIRMWHGDISSEECEDNHARQIGEVIDHLHQRVDWQVRGLVKEA